MEKSILIRLDLNNPEHKQAYEHLRNKDKKKHKSNSDLIARAVNSYFDKDNSDIEQVIKRCFAEVLAELDVRETSAIHDSEDIAWDFIGGDKPDIDV